MADTAQLRIGDQTIELPIVVGTEGERAIDISKLRKETGAITLDPGYVNTGSCQSAITFIDGDQGILRYRGIAIEDLAANSTFLEVAYLLVYGSLPTTAELESFNSSITFHTMIHEDFKRFFGAMPKDAHPMAACSAAIGALATFYPDSLDPRDPHHVEISVHRLIAKLPTMAAYSYKHSIGQPFMYPRNDLGYVGNFLYMLFGTPCEPYEIDPVIKKAINLLLILHADHEQNCSASTVRLVGSSMGNLFSAVSAGHSSPLGAEPRRRQPSGHRDALRDPRRGPQRQGVRRKSQARRRFGAPDGIRASRLQELRPAHDDHQEGLLRRSAETRYPDEAPRNCHGTGRDRVEGRLLRVTQALPQRRLLLGRDLQRDRNPFHLFTVLFALGRLPGWIAQWMELHTDPDFKIGRPRQIYTGPTETPYTPIENR